MTNIIGESVYNGTGDDAQNIGKVDDIVFDAAGKAKSAIIGVGGFLGVGQEGRRVRLRQARMGREERRPLAGRQDHQG
ncbi:MAG: PRC-barrel domain-containing protein [Nitrospira sp.]